MYGKRKCKHCKDEFEKKQPLQSVCSPYCGIQRTLELKKKKESKDWKKEKKVIKEKLKSHSDYEKELQALINQIANLIDNNHNCMSCSGNGKVNAGHYHSVGSNNSIRFNLFNIWRQCYRCNVQLSANIIGYDNGLISYLGKSKWEYIKFDLVRLHPFIKLSKEELDEKKAIARGIIKYLKLQDRTFTREERISLRERFNTELSIYK